MKTTGWKDDMYGLEAENQMKDTTLTMTFNAEKMDALTYHMGKKGADLQAERGDVLQKLYEKYVPQATREYLDDKIVREENARPARPSRPRPSAGTGREVQS